jgi:hypothetical protein
MTVPRALARYTCGAVNNMTLHLAGHAAFADLERAGRKSGIVRHAPVRAFRAGGHGDRRFELRPPAGLVAEHHGGRHLP